jgi:hypothetical protein
MTGKGDGQRERRVAERIDMGGRLPSQLELDMDTSVVQISSGGMMIEIHMPLAIGSKHGFTLTIGAEEVTLSGMVRNCRSLDEAAAENPLFHVGIEFCDLNEKQTRFLDDLVNRKL